MSGRRARCGDDRGNRGLVNSVGHGTQGYCVHSAVYGSIVVDNFFDGSLVAITFNQDSIAPEALATGVERQRLLDRGRVPRHEDPARPHQARRADLRSISTSCAATSPGSRCSKAKRCSRTARAKSRSARRTSFSCRRTSAARSRRETGAVFLYAQRARCRALRLRTSRASPPQFRVVDWTREPVLDSRARRAQAHLRRDAEAFRNEGDQGRDDHLPARHAGREPSSRRRRAFHVRARRAAARRTRTRSPIPVRKGDLIHYDDRERHYLRSEGTEDMVFVEFFVPGVYKTVWAQGAPVCTWIADRTRPARRQAGARHRGTHSATPTPQDV